MRPSVRVDLPELEAEQWRDDDLYPDLFLKAEKAGYIYYSDSNRLYYWRDTRKDRVLSPGDWIIKSKVGEYFLCTDKMFNLMFTKGVSK